MSQTHRRIEELCEQLYSRGQFSIKLGLSRMSAALERVEHLCDETTNVIIAGTNGKGTSATYLHGILSAHGIVSGLYTSPHLVGLEERFRINGEVVDDETLCDVLEMLLWMYAEVGDEREDLTFFELTTLAARLIFSRHNASHCVYEVGLGGRLDAVNALPASLTMITTIGYDHQAYLGDTIEQIATEKCGILRSGVQVIVGEQEYEGAFTEIKRQVTDARLGALYYGEDFGVDHQGIWLLDKRYDWSGAQSLQQMTMLQRRHASAAWTAAHQLLGQQFRAELAMQALSAVRWPGRLEVISISPDEWYLFDAAHNIDGVSSLVRHLQSTGLLDRSSGEMPKVTRVIFGGMRDKALADMIAQVSPELKRAQIPLYAAYIRDHKRAADKELLNAIFSTDSRLEGLDYRGAYEIEELIKSVGAEDTLSTLLFGSIYLLGECYKLLGLREHLRRLF